jgi:Ran GTPase-activating protein (RanGAP) involved in mRNA processing and transport
MDSDDDEEDYEDDEEYGEWTRSFSQERYEKIHKIETNDPTVKTLEIWEDYEVLGTAIGRNTHLQEVSVVVGYSMEINGFPEIIATDFRDFARGLALNRSIQKLSIAGWNHSNQDAIELSQETWNHLTQFFIDNEAFECLELELRWDVGNHRELITALRRFASLKEFKLSIHYDAIGRPGYNNVFADDVINVLIEYHTGLRKLKIAGFHIGSQGCAALSTSSITELYIDGLEVLAGLNTSRGRVFTTGLINEEGARVLANGLARNTKLKELKIMFSSKISENTWQTIFTAFSMCKVESLILHSNGLNDATLQSLSNALLHNTTLKSLNLGSNRAITNAGWVALSIPLQGIMLEMLDISENSIGDIGINAIVEAIENNFCLRELSLTNNSISGEGAIALATVLQNPNFALKKLDINNNSIGDNGVIALSTILRHPNSTLQTLGISKNSISEMGVNALTNALENNCTLKELSIDKNPITPAGLMNLSSILRNPTSVLEYLDVTNDLINNEVVRSFADALVENNSLKRLIVDCYPYNKVTSYGYDAFTNILCDTSSILNTFNSNHTLEIICHESCDYYEFYRSIGNVVLSLLKINRECSVSEAARLKIINTHFSGSEINMRPFMEMNLSVRPHAIAWMAKDMRVYELLQAMPSLLEQI